MPCEYILVEQPFLHLETGSKEKLWSVAVPTYMRIHGNCVNSSRASRKISFLGRVPTQEHDGNWQSDGPFRESNSRGKAISSPATPRRPSLRSHWANLGHLPVQDPVTTTWQCYRWLAQIVPCRVSASISSNERETAPAHPVQGCLSSCPMHVVSSDRIDRSSCHSSQTEIMLPISNSWLIHYLFSLSGCKLH